MNNDFTENIKIKQNCFIGYEFEFYCDLKPKSISKKLKELLGKEIKIGIKNLGKKDKIGYHTSLKPSENTFKLERDFSGGPKMYELITGPINYYEAKNILISVLEWITNYGYTNEYSSLHLNISFEDRNDHRLSARGMNIMKFCLGYDEEYIYKHFPKRRNNIYCASISKIYPKYEYMRSIYYNNIDPNCFRLPSDSKYYGVNFQKLKDNYLEFRYIGGKDYEKKIKEISEILDYNIEYMYSCLIGKELNTKETDIFQSMISKYKGSIDAFNSIENFMVLFPKINLSVDLKEEINLIKVHFETIKPLLYELVICNNVRTGYINYDTDVGRFQIKDTVIKNANHLKNLEIITSSLTGTYVGCSMFDCDIKEANLEDCILYDYTKVENSKIYSTIIKSSTELKKCFIKNELQEIAGSLKSCIVIGKEDSISDMAFVDKKTMFVKQDFDKLGISYGNKKEK